MRIDEFQQPSTLMARDVVLGLKSKMHLSQMGGNRVYELDGGLMGVVYLINRTMRAVGLTIDPQAGRLIRVGVWNSFDLDRAPDYEIDIPAGATPENSLGQIVQFVMTSNISESVMEDEQEFNPETDTMEVQLVVRRGRSSFRIPGMAKMEQKLTSMAKAMFDKGQGKSVSMEEQYHQLEGKVKMVAGGKAAFIKSLLITGAPSTGKTFRVMKVIKELGLKQGENYVTKKGKISAKSLYRVLIEQLHGLAIFDDCDSVVEDPNGVNMLKGALDTDPVRTVDYDVQGLLNTGAMTFERRKEIVEAMSVTLRGVAKDEDLKVIEKLMPEKDRFVDSSAPKSEGDDYPYEEYEDENGELAIRHKSDAPSTVSVERMQACERWVMNNLPNKIDYSGSIIFISNMSEDEWDSAIITRALHQDMNFGSGEMLDFIRTIQEHIKAKLTEEQKTEVLDYVQELYDNGQVTTQINFRFAMKCFDFYLMGPDGYDWKALVKDAAT